MKKKIPDNIMQKSINLINYGMSGIAFTKDDLLNILKSDDILGFAILGGDVLKLNSEKNKYNYTYDNWSISSRLVKESFEDYCKRCLEESINYIEKYPADESIAFSPVLTSEITAGM